MIHRPFLQITLCTRPLGLEKGPKGRNVTCQYVTTRKRKNKGKGKGKGEGKGKDIAASLAEGEAAMQVERTDGAEDSEGVPGPKRTIGQDNGTPIGTGDTGPMTAFKRTKTPITGSNQKQPIKTRPAGKRKSPDSSQTGETEAKTKKTKKSHPA
jgi:hypothetical protein